jgi:hypothetical protein
VTGERYGWQHQKERKRWEPVVAAGNGYCVQTDPRDPTSPPGSGCVMPTRWIKPGELWQLAHDYTGTTYLGPAHRRCNLRDAAIRGHRKRNQPTRWAL